LEKKKSDKYDVSNLVEAQFEPGSKGLVLKNLLGIKNEREIYIKETEEYVRVLSELIMKYDRDHRFTEKDIKLIHKEWLGAI
jgi:cell filamentation protein